LIEFIIAPMQSEAFVILRKVTTDGKPFMVPFVYVFHSNNSVAVSFIRRTMKSLLLVEVEA